MAGCLLGHSPRVFLLSGDVRRNSRNGVIGSIRLVVVADIEIQAAMRRRQRRPGVRHRDVPQGDRCQRDGETGREDSRGSPPVCRCEKQREDGRRKCHVRTIARLHAEGQTRQ